MFEIEEGIPIPKNTRNMKRDWGKIPIGASTFVADVKVSTVHSMVGRFSARNNMKFTVRKVEKDGVKGARVWRIS